MKLTKILCVEEHQIIYDKIIAGDYDGAIVALEALDEMSRQDSINMILSHIKVLLVHLIKENVENRKKRKWTISIRNSLIEIVIANHIGKTKGHYIDNEERWRECLNDRYDYAIQYAVGEMRDKLDHHYTVAQVYALADKSAIFAEAIRLITDAWLHNKYPQP